MARGWLHDLLGTLVRVAGVEAVSRRALNFIAGDGVTITAEDNPGSEQTDLTISASASEGALQTEVLEYTGPTDYYGDNVIAATIDLADYPWAEWLEYLMVGPGQGGQSGDLASGGYGGGSGGLTRGRTKIRTPGTGTIEVYVGRGGPGGVYDGGPVLGGIGGNTMLVSTAIELNPLAWPGGMDPNGGGELPGAGWAPGGAPGVLLPPDVTAPFDKVMTHAGQQEFTQVSDVGTSAAGSVMDGGGGARGLLVARATAEADSGVTATGAGGQGGGGYGAGGGGGGGDAATPGDGGAAADGFVRLVLSSH